MRKIIVFAVSIVVMLAIAACGGGSGGSGSVLVDEVPASNHESTNQDDPQSGNQNQDNYDYPDMPTNEPLSGDLTISAFDSIMMGPFLEQAAELFTYKHPDVNITVESFSAVPEMMEIEMEDGTTAQVMRVEGGPHQHRDYINQVNTELMSGRGPDILTLDILPFHRYAMMRHLANLQTLMDNDPNFNTGDYRANILDAITSEDGLFKFPITIDFSYLTFDSSLFTPAQKSALLENDTFTVEELFDIARPALEDAHTNGNEHLMMALPEFMLFLRMFDLYQGHFIDIHNRQANFTDGIFVEMLNQIKRFSDAGYLHGDWADNVRTLGGTAATERYFYGLNPNLMLFNEFNRDDPVRWAMDFSGRISDDDLIAGLLKNSFGQVPFALGERMGGAAFGINANSPNQALAWEFIKFLSSYALMELIQSPGGIPLHVGALEEVTRRWATNAIFSEQQGESIELTAAEQARFDAYMETVDHFMSLFNTFNVTDTIIRDMVIEAVREFFDGDISAEDLANRLQSSIHLVLNE